MMNEGQKILFIVNSSAGRKKNADWPSIIKSYFEQLPYTIGFFMMLPGQLPTAIRDRISEFRPDIVVAVGGDGTLSCVVKELIGSGIPLGVIPAGSANGMARELGIPVNAQEALNIIVNSNPKKTDAILINEKHICFHLSDVGLNAQLVNYFEQGPVRGKIGYALALIKALYRKRRIQVKIRSKGAEITRDALMVIIANASKYGTGATINPKGNIHDEEFEVVIIRKLPIPEIMKMFRAFQRFDPRSIEVFSATSAAIETRKPAHFQVDGEYLGKISRVDAKILPGKLDLIIPGNEN